MNFLDRNTLPKFQERLDLAASELNDAEDIFCKAINELAGRIYILANVTPPEEREEYAEETNFLLLDTLARVQNDFTDLRETVQDFLNQSNEELHNLEAKYVDLEARLNALDDAAARKEDLNVLYYRVSKDGE